MRSKEAGAVPEKGRRPARDVIDAVLANMRENLEPLKYSTLAPCRYVVYLHPVEYARLEGIVAILREQTIRALSEEIRTLNRPSVLRHYAQRLLGEEPGRKPGIENPREWSVEFLPNADDDLNEGDILVDSELLLPASPDLGIGERTRKVFTIHSASQRTTTRKNAILPPGSLPSPRSAATIEYDDTAGHHSYDIKSSITIGRGGNAYPVDIRIVSSADVSREHARIRLDEQTGSFFLIDLSTLGTTLNGREVPRGYDEVDGARRVNGAETLLPDDGRIGLADTVYLRFRVVRQ
jgi:hypothetical protein